MKETLILIFFLFSFYLMAHKLVLFFKSSKNGNRNIWLFSLSMGFLLMIITVTLLPKFSSLIPAQNQAFELLSFLPEGNKKKQQQNKFIENFFFIDNSFSHQKILRPGSERSLFDTSSAITITDRAELSKLLENLASLDTLIDLVICDIYFDYPGTNDSMLRKALSHPKILPKLLLSHNFTQPNTAIFKSLPDSVQGNIAENGQSNFFSEYSIYSNKSPSLALLIAKKITGNRYQPILFDNFVYQKTPQGDVALGLNTFLPKFNYTDPGKLLGEEITLESDSSSFFDIRYNTLGNAVSDIGSEDLKFQLENRKIQGKKNYIFIGAFNSGEDRHDTYYGKLSGPIILINLSYAIIEGQYRFNLLYILFLTISLSYILVILIKLSLGIPLLYPFKEQIEKKLKKEKIAVSKKTATRSVLLAFNDVMKLVFLDELHFWLVVLLVVMTAVIFDKLINGFGLIIVFLILYKVMQLISKHKKS